MIVAVKEGQVAETGTHDELMAIPNGIYKTLVRLQVRLHVVIVCFASQHFAQVYVFLQRAVDHDDKAGEQEDEDEEEDEDEDSQAWQAEDGRRSLTNFIFTFTPEKQTKSQNFLLF